MSKSSELSQTKAELEAREEVLLNELTAASHQLEQLLSKQVKVTAVVGLSLLVGYSLFKLFEAPTKKKQRNSRRLSGFGKVIATQVAKNVWPMVQDYFNSSTTEVKPNSSKS